MFNVFLNVISSFLFMVHLRGIVNFFTYNLLLHFYFKLFHVGANSQGNGLRGYVIEWIVNTNFVENAFVPWLLELVH